MPSLSCSFVTFSNKSCDISKRFPGVSEYFPLTSCHQDIKAHLRTVNVSQLILARSGHFEEEGLNMTVERLRFTFTPNGKREFVPRDQVFPLFFVYCLLLLHKNK